MPRTLEGLGQPAKLPGKATPQVKRVSSCKPRVSVSKVQILKRQGLQFAGRSCRPSRRRFSSSGYVVPHFRTEHINYTKLPPNAGEDSRKKKRKEIVSPVVRHFGGAGERLAVQRHVLHVVRLLDRREVLPGHLHSGRYEPPELHLAYSFRADVALRRLARSPGITESPIFETPNVSRPTSFSDAPIE